jgi:lysophospholipase L1-like esterase
MHFQGFSKVATAGRANFRRGIVPIALVAALIGVTSIDANAATIKKGTAAKTAPGVKPLLVGMGASWTAGAGNTPYTGNPDCYRSASNAYPVLAAKRLGFSVRNVGCSGADTADVRSAYQGERAQTSQLAGASWIALNVGANNVDFWGMIESGNTSQYSAVISGLPDMQSGVKKDLAAIHAANPTAKVVVLGYADFIPSTDAVWKSCMGSTIATNSVANLHKAFTKLNANIKAAAAAYGDVFVDPTPAFAGHGVCSGGTNRWIFNMDEDFDLHPNASGQHALATVVANAIRARL